MMNHYQMREIERVQKDPSGFADYYGLSNGEAVGYMSGDAEFLLAEDICEHGCPHCGKEER